MVMHADKWQSQAAMLRGVMCWAVFPHRASAALRSAKGYN